MLRIEGIPGSARSLRLVGELDLATADMLKRAIDHNGFGGSGDVHLDLSGIEFIDSSGLRTIMQIADALSGQGQLVLDSPGQAVRRLLELTGITHFPNLVVATASPSPSSPSPTSPERP